MSSVARLAHPTVAGTYVVAALSLAALQLLYGPAGSFTGTVVVIVAWVAIAVGIFAEVGWVIVLSAALFPAAAILGSVLAGMEPMTGSALEGGLLVLLAIAQAPLQFAILLIDTDTSVGMLSWIAYLAHLGLLGAPVIPGWLLGPDTRARLGAVEPIAVAPPAEELELPEAALDLFMDNPFRVLGLDRRVRSKQIRKRAADIPKFLNGGRAAHDVPGYLRVGSGRSPIDGEAVAAAHAQLQNAPDRVRHSLLWLDLTDASDEARFAMSEGRFSYAIREWEDSLKFGTAEEKARTLHNLAVATHARALAEEAAGADPAQLTVRGGFREALGYWQLVLDSDEWWASVLAELDAETDPRVRGAFREELRPWLAARVLEGHMELARSAASQGWHEYAGEIVDQVRKSGFDEQWIARALEPFVGETVSRARTELEGLLDAPRPSNRRQARKTLAAAEPIRSMLADQLGPQKLAEILETVVGEMVDKLRRDSVAVFTAYFDALNAFARQSNSLIDEWNRHMQMHNLGVGSALADCASVHQRFKSRSGELKNMLKTLKRGIGELQLLLDVLVEFAGDGSPEAIAAARAEREDNQQHLDKAVREHGELRSAFQESVNRQSQNLV